MRGARIAVLGIVLAAGCSHARPRIADRAEIVELDVVARPERPRVTVDGTGEVRAGVVGAATGGLFVGALYPIALCAKLGWVGLIACGAVAVVGGPPVVAAVEIGAALTGAAYLGSKKAEAHSETWKAIDDGERLLQREAAGGSWGSPAVVGALKSDSTLAYALGRAGGAGNRATVELSVTTIAFELVGAMLRPRVEVRARLLGRDGTELGRVEVAQEGARSLSAEHWSPAIGGALTALAQEAGRSAAERLLGRVETQRRGERTGAMCGLAPTTDVGGAAIRGLGAEAPLVIVSPEGRRLSWERWIPQGEELPRGASVSYELRVWSPERPSELLVDARSLADPVHRLGPELSPDSVYAWSARAVVSIGSRRFSTAWTQFAAGEGCDEDKLPAARAPMLALRPLPAPPER